MELKAGYKKTEVGVIPEDWKIKTIDDVATVVGGGTPSTTNLLFWNGFINWFTPTEIGLNKYVFESNRKITEDGLKNSSARMLPKGTILLTSRAGIGDLAILKKRSSTNQGFQSLISKDNIDNEFLYYLMSISKKRLIEKASGSTFLEISPNNLKQIQIPLPPLPEQKAIATVLSDTDNLIQALEKKIAKKQLIKKGAMQKLLEPKEDWKKYILPKVCWFQEGPGVRNSQFTNKGVKLLNGTNIEKGKLLLEKTDRYISTKEAFGWYSHFLVDDGDILIASSGVTIEKFHEKVTIAERKNLPLCMNTSTMRFKTISQNLRKEFLFYFLKSNFFKQQIGGKATGSAQLNFGPSHVSKVNINIPSYKEQTRIAKILSDMDSEIETLEKKLKKYKQIKQGLMQVLLTGKIRLV